MRQAASEVQNNHLSAIGERLHDLVVRRNDRIFVRQHPQEMHRREELVRAENDSRIVTVQHLKNLIREIVVLSVATSLVAIGKSAAGFGVSRATFFDRNS